ncbi:unnamed protein product [Linum tenue]|uniref:Uncharacterized protein n=1 Tax=Linum tenue TaxID=586396 RepID=A0AAV0KIL5_9ROSI|nr:unnamed protein product [Linum tenue]
MEEREKADFSLPLFFFFLSSFHSSKILFPDLNLLSSLVLQFFLQQSMEKLQPLPSNSVTLQILLLSSCSFLLFFFFSRPQNR